MILENCSTLEITCILHTFLRYSIKNVWLYDYEDYFRNQSYLSQWKYSMGFLALIVILDRGQTTAELVFKKQQPEICQWVSNFKPIKVNGNTLSI